jgi:hypothetical protein
MQKGTAAHGPPTSSETALTCEGTGRTWRWRIPPKAGLDLQNLSEIALTCGNSGAPNGIRTRAAALKGRCPRPLDDGGSKKTIPLAGGS